jgi:hypothetical protein
VLFGQEEAKHANLAIRIDEGHQNGCPIVADDGISD